jgi:N-acetylmuramoyl-L-alanine amidase
VHYLPLAALILLPLLALAGDPVELRDITVAPSATTATITFLFDGKVGTVVLEKKSGGVAEIRMKSVRAEKATLASATLKPGVRSVKAHIERTDVLVTDVTFTREVTAMQVTERNAERVVVLVTLGNAAPARRTPATASTGTGASPKPKQSGAASTGASRGEHPARTTEGRGKWSLSTIVIDAGHGGKDPGAIGIGDVQEKDVTLAVAKRLRDEIKRAMPGVTVVMTRDDDRFIELYRRGQIANERDGRLFISIHCNSMPTKPNPASGFECYILRPGKLDDAARVAAAENGAIRFEADRKKYDDMSAESAIVASMAQSAFVRYSESLAGAIRSAMRGRTGIPDRGVHQAGFFVLVGASMPSVLVEIGYLSNSSDAKVLSSASGRKKIARALFEGIRQYEKIYSASLR